MDFEDLYHEYKSLVYNLAQQYVQNQADAEEITQDVFISIYQNRDSFQKRSSIKTWIYRITINKSIDFIKSRNRIKLRFFFNAIQFNNSDDHIRYRHFDHPCVILEQKEAVKSIFDAINLLPERQKTAIILLKIENKTQKETALIMQCSVKSVESLYQRAKDKLSKHIKNEGK